MIFVVSEIFYPEDTSTGYYVTEIAAGLAQQNPVHVLCSAPANVDVAGLTLLHRGVTITRIGKTDGRGASVWLRVMSAAFRVVRMMAWLSRHIDRSSVIVTVTNPPLLPPAMAFLSLCTGAKLIVIVHDLYPHASIVAGVVNRNGWIACILNTVQRWTFRRSNTVICIGRDMVRAVAHLEASAQIVLIPNWAEERPSGGIILNKATSKFANKYARPAALTVLHAGNLGKTHDLVVILEAAHRLRKISSVRFLFAVPNPNAPFRAALEQTGLENVDIGNMAIGRDQQWDTLAAGDIVLIAFRRDMAGVSVPSRMYNAMQAGKPIIAVADADSEIATVIHEENIGWVVEPQRADLLSDAILEACRDPERLRDMGARAQFVANKDFNKKAMLERYAAVVHRVTAQKTSNAVTV